MRLFTIIISTLFVVYEGAFASTASRCEAGDRIACARMSRCEAIQIRPVFGEDPCSSCAHEIDECGVCGGDGTSCMGCDGIPNSDIFEDECGVCGGDGSSCLDCSGEPNGDKTLDACGVCGGDGSSCLSCSEHNQSAVLRALRVALAAQTESLRSLTREYTHVKRGMSAKKQMQILSSEGKLLQKEATAVTTLLPTVVLTCETPVDQCVTVDVRHELDQIKRASDRLYSLSRRLYAKLARKRATHAAKSYLARASREHRKAEKVLTLVAAESMECDMGEETLTPGPNEPGVPPAGMYPDEEDG